MNFAGYTSQLLSRLTKKENSDTRNYDEGEGVSGTILIDLIPYRTEVFL